MMGFWEFLTIALLFFLFIWGPWYRRRRAKQRAKFEASKRRAKAREKLQTQAREVDYEVIEEDQDDN
ncbi:hypothetical protein [Pontibacter sp. G13]|uniref:hypothetical protein n=1 Tax=Pontibacter sp. G13 TaxID=3074898 RepID=UPI00288C2761|nr:hypothetical protein [Pontibacter sp. G13]WNJ17230.1 hypothetical protein RJD25_20430 [Pontibacter sp. G13]